MMKNVVLSILLVFQFSVGLFQHTAEAETYPSRPIQIVIPMTPGDMTDLTARIVSSELEKILRAPIVHVNKPGGGATIGADFVAKAKKDGYTLLYAGSNIYYAHAMNPETVPSNPLQDLDALCLAVSVPSVFMTQADAPWKTMQELVDYMRQNPGKVRVGTTGVGGVGHFNLEIIQGETGTTMTMVPFKGSTPAMTALLGGHVEVALLATGQVVPHVRAGKLRTLLISQKLPGFTDVPTLKDLGFKRDTVSIRNAFYAPVGLSDSIKNILIPALEKSIKSAETVNAVHQLNASADYVPQGEFKKMMAEEYGMVRQLLKGAGGPAKK